MIGSESSDAQISLKTRRQSSITNASSVFSVSNFFISMHRGQLQVSLVGRKTKAKKVLPWASGALLDS